MVLQLQRDEGGEQLLAPGLLVRKRLSMGGTGLKAESRIPAKIPVARRFVGSEG